MKSRSFAFLLLLLLVATAFGQQTFVGRVLDAETQEPLPYANVRTRTAATLANVEGDFSLRAEPTDTVTFTCVGYRSHKVCLRDMPSTILMNPLASLMSEVEIRAVPVDDVLKKLIRKIGKEQHRGEKYRQIYFYRSSVTDDTGSEMLEAFIDAKSAINVRDMYLISGIARDGYKGEGSEIGLMQTNIHRLLELGPSTKDSYLWRFALCPFEDYWKTKYSYDCSATILKGEEGRDIYKLSLTLKDSLAGTPAEWHVRRKGQLVEGTFYVDAKTLNLLRMDANVKNVFQQVLRNSGKRTIEEVKLEIHAEYQRRRNVDEVARISMSNEGEHVKFNCFLFDVHDMENIPGRGDRQRKAIGIGSNLMSALDRTSFDAPYWDMYDIVKRTAAEERTLFGSSLVDGRQEEKVFAADTAGTDNAELRRIWQRLWASSWQRAQEKVYVHLDNTSYRLGETIWFSAYVRDTDRKCPSRQSGVLYVELLDQNGFLVERKQVELKNGRGFGNFTLNRQIQYAGFYELRAYTRWQLGWGAFEREHPAELSAMFVNEEKEHAFFRDYDKLYSRVFPVYDSIPGEDGQWRTITPKPLIRPAKKASKAKDRKLLVSLFPEGGHLIYGKQNEVAFEAVWDDGEWAEGELQWSDIPVKTTSRGRGRFFVMPMTEESRELTFVPLEGKPVKLMLPESEQSGVALHTAEEVDGWHISVNCTDDLSPEHLGLTIMNEGKLCYFRPLAKRSSTFLIPPSALPQGVCQATVFDDEGRVYADRLFFSWHEGMEKPTLTAQGLKESYAPYERVRLDIKRTEPADAADLSAVISLSVRDAGCLDSTFDNASILAEMLLSSEIKGFVPDPAWFFQKHDEEHRDALDLLLLTQGWRRFRWEEMNAERDSTELSRKPEKVLTLEGKVYGLPLQAEDGRKTRKDERKWVLHTEAVSLWDMKHTHMYDILPPDGHFSLSLPRTNYDFVMFMDLMRQKLKKEIKEQKDRKYEYTPDMKLGEKMSKKQAKKLQKQMARKKALMEAKEKAANAVPNFLISCDLPYPHFVKPYTYYQTRLMAGSIQQLKPKFTGFKDQYPTLLMGDYEIVNKGQDFGFRNGKQQAMALLCTGNMGAGRLMRYGNNRFRRNYTNTHLVPEDSTYAPKYLKSYHPTFRLSWDELDEYKGEGAIENYVVYTDASLREPSLEGKDTIIIAQYPYRDGNRRWSSAARCFGMQGFSVANRFYNPDYSRFALQEQHKDIHRRTLYWNPAVNLDKNGEAHIVFFNNGSAKTFSVEAEGQAPNGTLLWSQ